MAHRRDNATGQRAPMIGAGRVDLEHLCVKGFGAVGILITADTSPGKISKLFGIRVGHRLNLQLSTCVRFSRLSLRTIKPNFSISCILEAGASRRVPPAQWPRAKSARRHWPWRTDECLFQLRGNIDPLYPAQQFCHEKKRRCSLLHLGKTSIHSRMKANFKSQMVTDLKSKP